MALAAQKQGLISGSHFIHLSLQFSSVIASQVQTSAPGDQRGQDQSQDKYSEHGR